MMPILIALDNPKKRASYLVVLLVHIHVNQKENIFIYLIGDLNTTPAPHLCLHLALSKNIVHTLNSFSLVIEIS